MGIKRNEGERDPRRERERKRKRKKEKERKRGRERGGKKEIQRVKNERRSKQTIFTKKRRENKVILRIHTNTFFYFYL